MAAVRQIKAHEAAVRRHERLVDLEVGRAAAQGLDVDAPALRIEVEGLERALLAQQLRLVDVLVAAVVPRPRVALAVLVGHGRAQRVEDGPRRHILRRNQDDGLALPLDLALLYVVPGRCMSIGRLCPSGSSPRVKMDIP